MREIKFRAWCKLSCAMIAAATIQDMSEGSCDKGFTSYCVFMQYTGLKDRHGVEIYEGDIVTWGDVDGYIEMSGTRVAVVDMSAPEDGLTFDAFKPIKSRFKIGNFMYRRSAHKCMTVIGNIYENPELLEV